MNTKIRAGFVIVMIAAVFFVGAALFDEQVVGYRALPVQAHTTSDAHHTGKSTLVIDSAPQTTWLSAAAGTSTDYWEVEFNPQVNLTGVSIDTGDSFRFRLSPGWLQPKITPRVEADHERFFGYSVLDICQIVSFDVRRVTKLQIAPHPSIASQVLERWALRDVRFLTDEFYNFDAQSYQRRWIYLLAPFAAAILWCWWIAAGRNAKNLKS